MASERKSYAQVCPMATALDVVGDRWTMLILRELLGGAARFNELRDGLPGIAGNLLAERLRRLEEDRVVRQVASGGSTLYALTEVGADIRLTLEELAFWGARMGRVAPAEHERSIRAVAMALHAILVRARSAMPDERVVLELAVDDDTAEVVLGPRPSVTVRPSIDPDARARISAAGMSSVLRGEDTGEARFAHVAGDEAVTTLFAATLGV